MSSLLPSQSPTPYPFEPLQDASSQVRVLRLKPADSPFCLVECELHGEKLNGSQFVAFYTPLDDQLEEDHLILCNGDLRAVSKILYDCLWQLRADGCQELWLPALCVDWNSTEEKRRQLTLWPEIFGKDARWLPFQHGSLDDENVIRMIELEPAENNDEVLQARLHEVSLKMASDQSQYTFLEIPRELTGDSWSDRNTMFCNGQPVDVSRYLDTKLRSARAQNRLRLWVDAICLDFASETDVQHHNNIAELIRAKAARIVEAYPSEFRYQSLASASTSIRLLQVRPARYRHDPLVVDVTSFPIGQSPDYTALSYTWGSSESKGPIFISDGSVLEATRNLIGGLGDLRHKGYLTVWADAICINQDDNDERNQQVLLMGEIYRRAKRVVIELGITCTFEGYMRRHSYTQILVKMLALTSRVLRAVRPEYAVVKPPELAKFGLPPAKHRAWNSLQELRAAPWFTRSWIVQECVANSTQVEVVYNGRWYTWKDIVEANGVCQFEIMPMQSMIGKLTMINMGFLGSTLSSRTPYTLLDLVSTFRNMESSDPRDKIYAFRGLVSDKLLAPLPDYSKSVEEVYTEFATYFVSQGQGMQLLCEAGTMRFNEMQTLPSWVAEWSFNADWGASNYNKGAPSHVPLEYVTPERCHYPASEVTLSQNPRVLSVTGSHIDRVSLVTSAGANRADSKGYEDYQTSMKALFNEARKMVQVCPQVQKRYGPSLGHAFYKTIMGGEMSEQLEDYVESSGHLGERAVAAPKHGNVIDQEAPPTSLLPALFTQDFDRGIADHLGNRRFCVTRDGYIGLVSMLTKPDDLVVILKGARAPFVLKQTVREPQARHVLIGEAYIHGMIQDEGMETLDVRYEDILIE